MQSSERAATGFFKMMVFKRSVLVGLQKFRAGGWGHTEISFVERKFFAGLNQAISDTALRLLAKYHVFCSHKSDPRWIVVRLRAYGRSFSGNLLF